MVGKIQDFARCHAAAVWLSAAEFRQVMGATVAAVAALGQTCTVQMRKATSAAGANAANHGPLVTATAAAAGPLSAHATAIASELGDQAPGVPYTHISMVAGGTATTPVGVLVSDGGYARFRK